MIGKERRTKGKDRGGYGTDGTRRDETRPGWKERKEWEMGREGGR